MRVAASPRLHAVSAAARGLFGRGRTPPGDLIALDEAERRDRRALIRRAGRLGPVFKGVMEGRLAIFVTGSRRGRRLLKAHDAALRPVTLDISALAPGGFMRRMSGEEHRRRRGRLVAALADLDPAEAAPAFRAILRAGLGAHAAGRGGPAPLRLWSEALHGIATRLTVRQVFGPDPGAPAHERLVAAFGRLGARGVVWRVDAAQAAAYAEVAAAVGAVPEAEAARGLLGALRRRGPVDETMLGNLIYMTEFGRYDLRGLMQWTARFALAHPEAAARVAGGRGEASAEARRFALEVLRHEQSERLMRDVLADFVFDGFRFPRGALLRVCLWENHKDPESFAEPWAFDPERFAPPGAEGRAFSPFGLDRHRCPYGGVSVELAALFLETLVGDFVLSGDPGGEGRRGPYHWEPGAGHAVALSPRGAA